MSVCVSLTILVVECPSERNLIGTVLEKGHYTVLLENKAGAREALRREDRVIDLLIAAFVAAWLSAIGYRKRALPARVRLKAES